MAASTKDISTAERRATKAVDSEMYSLGDGQGKR
jgi:hypothetical protein